MILKYVWLNWLQEGLRGCDRGPREEVGQPVLEMSDERKSGKTQNLFRYDQCNTIIPNQRWTCSETKRKIGNDDSSGSSFAVIWRQKRCCSN